MVLAPGFSVTQHDDFLLLNSGQGFPVSSKVHLKESIESRLVSFPIKHSSWQGHRSGDGTQSQKALAALLVLGESFSSQLRPLPSFLNPGFHFAQCVLHTHSASVGCFHGTIRTFWLRRAILSHTTDASMFKSIPFKSGWTGPTGKKTCLREAPNSLCLLHTRLKCSLTCRNSGK